MAWIRPRYWKVLETHGTTLELPKATEPYVSVNKRSDLTEWKNKALKNSLPFVIAQYGAMVEGQPEPMRVFGLFVFPLGSQKETLQAPQSGATIEGP